MTHWKRWFAWYPVALQNGGYAWLCPVEYEQVNIGQRTGAFGSGPRTITHYRMPDDAPEFHTASR
jgi:hypothetical protein